MAQKEGIPLRDARHQAWLLEAYKEAAKSSDPSTQIGTGIISRQGTLWPGTLAHNDPVRGWKMQPEHWERPMKYSLMNHAERSAIFKAAAAGLATGFCTMVATWAACDQCAIAIVESGIKTLVRHAPPLDDASDRWMEQVDLGDRILKAGGVEIISVTGPILGAPKILRSGALYDPAFTDNWHNHLYDEDINERQVHSDSD